MDIGTKFKEARLRRGLTQEQAASAAQVSRQTMSNWENGRSLPDILSVIRLAQIYGITLDQLTQEPKETSPKLSFLMKNWDALFSAAAATIPLALLAEHYLSLWAAFALLVMGAALFAVPRLMYSRLFGVEPKALALGLLGWTLITARTV